MLGLTRRLPARAPGMNFKARLRQARGQSDLEEHPAHAALYQGSSQRGLARYDLPALWSRGITYERPRPDSGFASVLAVTCAGGIVSGLLP